MPQVQPIKENFSNLLTSDGNCSLLFEEINQHLAASAKIDPCPVLSTSGDSFGKEKKEENWSELFLLEVYIVC